MRRGTIAILMVGLIAGLGPAAAAETHDVSIEGISAGFDPSNLKSALGDEVRWTNNDSIGHTSTQSGGLALWSSGTLGSDDTFSFELTAAGTYPYHCAIHTSMTGRVRVPVQAGLLESGKIRVVVASAAPEDGFVFDVQRKVGNGDWTLWKDGITRKTISFRPSGDGTYSFRARLRRESGGASKWSPAASVTV